MYVNTEILLIDVSVEYTATGSTVTDMLQYSPIKPYLTILTDTTTTVVAMYVNTQILLIDVRVVYTATGSTVTLTC